MVTTFTRPRGGALAVVGALLPIGLLALLPSMPVQPTDGKAAIEAFHGRILSLDAPAPGGRVGPPSARVQIVDGPRAGEVIQAHLEGPGGSQIIAGYRPGDDVVVTMTQGPTDQPYVAVADRWRLPLLGWIGLVFAAAVVMVGGWRGLRALIALGLTIAVILKVLVPLVIAGAPPVPLAVVTATGITIATILLTEGWSRTSRSAILGTAAALALTGVLSMVGTALGSFSYTGGSDLAFLATTGGQGLDLRGLLLAGFILGAVGVLDDVTVTQAALVESLAARGAHGRELVAEAFDVGRSHIAATINTLFLAYIGVALPLVVALIVSQQPSALVLNSEDVATEVIRTIAGSLGIVTAVPLTTLFAAVALAPERPGRFRSGAVRRLTFLGGSAALIVLALAATALVPLGGSRAPLPNEQFDPSAIPGLGAGLAPSDAPTLDDVLPSPDDASTAPGPSPADAELLLPGQVFALTAGDATVEVEVTKVTHAKVGAGIRVRVTVAYTNDGPDPFEIDPAAWSVINPAGPEVPMTPGPKPSLTAISLPPGQRAVGTLSATIVARAADAFIAFTDDAGTILFAVPVE